MNKNKWLITGIVVIVLAILVAVGYQHTSNKTESTSSTIVGLSSDTHVINDLKLSYQLSPASQKLYNINVLSAAQFAAQNNIDIDKDSGDVYVTGKACNNMTGTISVLAKGSSTGKQIVKILHDGRIVLQPVTMSTLMACTDITPATDDQALNAVIDTIAQSLQSL